MRLCVKISKGFARMMDTTMREFACQHFEVDEIWGFVGKKERSVKMRQGNEVGSFWTWYAIDADTKLVPLPVHEQHEAKRHVTVLHLPPVVSPLTAVRVAIMQEYYASRAAQV